MKRRTTKLSPAKIAAANDARINAAGDVLDATHAMAKLPKGSPERRAAGWHLMHLALSADMTEQAIDLAKRAGFLNPETKIASLLG